MDDNVTRILASLSDRTAPGPDKRHGVRESLSSPGKCQQRAFSVKMESASFRAGAQMHGRRDHCCIASERFD
jgi:hypothetical protein